MGYAHKIYIVCRDCNYKEYTYTSKKSQKVSKSQGHRKYDINIRRIVAFCEIGKGKHTKYYTLFEYVLYR